MKINSIYKKTIFDYRKSIFFWSLGIVLIGLMYAALYPSISGASFTKAFEDAPAALNAFIGSAAFFSTPNGFINGEFFTLTMPLVLCILAITIGSSLIGKEEESGTIELLLARPVARSKILSGKLLSLVTIICTLGISVWLGLFFGHLIISQFTITLPNIALAIINLCLLAIAFGSIAFMVSGLKNSRAMAAGLAGSYFLASYIVGTFGSQVLWLGHFKILSLFNYYNTADILQNNINWWNFIVLALVIAVSYIFTGVFYSHRDSGK